jgi:hypothetical protein
VKLSIYKPLKHTVEMEVQLRSFLTSKARIAQSVQRPATGWRVRGSNSGGSEIYRTRPDRPRGPPSFLYNGYRVFSGGKAARGGVDHPPHLAPWLKNE